MEHKSSISNLRFELSFPTAHLLREISTPKMLRNHIAETYAMALRSSVTTDWSKVNHAIIKRWSLAGLEYIKKRAWKIVGNR